MLLTAIIPIGNISRCHRNLISRIEQASELNFQIKLVFDDVRVDEVDAFFSKIGRKENIKVFCGKYGQAGIARNEALKDVTTRWLVFWDSDDDVYPERVFEMVRTADNRGAQGAIASYELTSESSIASPLLRTYYPDKEGQPDFDSALGIWRLAFRTDVIHGNKIDFPSLRVGEDVLFVLKFLLLNPVVSLFPSIVYNYSVGNVLQTTSIRTKSEDTLLIILELLRHSKVNLSHSNHKLIRQLLVLQFLTLMRSFHMNGISRSRMSINFNKREICFNCFFLIPVQSVKRAFRVVLSHKKGVEI